MAKKNNNEDGTRLAKVLWYYNLLPNVNHYKHKIMCPFHGDVNPSLLVNLEEGRWFCFGCNESGDAIAFVKLMEKKYHKLNDLQAYRKYCEILKSKKCSDIEIDQARIAREVKPQKQMYDEAYDYYHGLRTVDWLDDEEPEVLFAKEYMSKRGFSPKTLNKCKAKVTYNNSYGLYFQCWIMASSEVGFAGQCAKILKNVGSICTMKGSPEPLQLLAITERKTTLLLSRGTWTD